LTPRRELWIAAGIFTALTVVLTWPQVIRLQSIYPHEDSLFNMWRLAWFAHAMRTNPLELFQANIFWPERDTLAYSDAMLFEGVLATPLLWAGVPAPVVQSLLILGSFVFSGCGAFVLGRYLTGRFSGGVLAGIVFAFAPFRFDHYMHLELLWSGWMPLAVLALLRAFEAGSPRWAVGTALLALMQTLSSIYYGVFLILVLGVMTLVLWWGQAKEARRRVAAGLAAGGVFAAILLSPYVQPYRRARDTVGERLEGTVSLHSAGPMHYFAATPGNWIYGGYANRISRHEKRLFAGAIGLGLAVIGLWPPIDRRRVAFALGLGMALYLSAGMEAPGFAALREHVEIFRGLRAPARAAQLVLLFIGVFAAYGLIRLHAWLQTRRSPVAAYAPALCASVLVLEYAAMPVALLPAPPRSPSSAWLADQPAGVVAELPMPIGFDRTHEPDVIYQSTFHWNKLVNGHSGNLPLSNYTLYKTVEKLPAPEGLEALKRAGVRYIIVHEAWYGTPTYRSVIQFFNTRPDLMLRATFPNGEYAIAAYEVKPS
jgi:hypothetical protein